MSSFVFLFCCFFSHSLFFSFFITFFITGGGGGDVIDKWYEKGLETVGVDVGSLR